jgi:hypothetical protein
MSDILNLERIRKEAKTILKQCRAGDAAVIVRLRDHFPRLITLDTLQFASQIKLCDIHHALAHELGYRNWMELKTQNSPSHFKMFARYSQRARRVLFFARYEASHIGSHTIETEHLLLGLLNEDRYLIRRFRPDFPSIESIRTEIASLRTIRKEITLPAAIPLSKECKRIMTLAVEEAELLNGTHVDTAHLLLGLFRDGRTLASSILCGHGLNADAIRQQLKCSTN